MLLTLGMSAYDDFHGVVFTCQSLALHNDLSDCEIVVVDTRPGSKHGKDTKNFCAKGADRPFGAVRYIPFEEQRGTTQGRQQIFEVAQGEFVLVMDCHVLLRAGTIDHLKRWVLENRSNSDLVTGPLILDNLSGFHTHFNDVWRGGMWGTWGTAWRCRCGQTLFAVLEQGDQLRCVDLKTTRHDVAGCPRCGQFPASPFAGHEQALLAAGCQPHGFSDSDQPFEIPAMGLGLFGARKESWPGFSPHFRGFGGEEFYIHEKFRQRGDRALCLPWLKWWHRFGRPDGTGYSTRFWDRCRNYVLGHQELNMPLDPVFDHFANLDTHGEDLAAHVIRVHSVEGQKARKAKPEELAQIHAAHKIPAEHWEYLVADPINHVNPPVVTAAATEVQLSVGGAQPPAEATLDQVFAWACATKRDLDEHLPLLKALASQVEHATEISKRRESTVALLAARPATVVSYVGEHDVLLKTLDEAIVADAAQRGADERRVLTHQIHWVKDDGDLNPIAATDLLFIHSVHCAARLTQELHAHAGQVRRYLILKSTAVFGDRGEGECAGLFHALRPWLDSHPDWRVIDHWDNQWGLTILSRQASDYPEYSVVPWRVGAGPGASLKKLLSRLGVMSGPTCDCNARAAQMDKWGITRCQERRELIVGWLKEGQERWGWAQRLRTVSKAAGNAITSGLAFKINWLDPLPGLLDEAIRLAKEALKDEG